MIAIPGTVLASPSESEVAQSCQTLCNPWTVAYQAPLSMGFSRQECWSGLPFPSPGDLPDPGIKPRSPALRADALPSEPPGKHCIVMFQTGSFDELGTLHKHPQNPHSACLLTQRLRLLRQEGEAYFLYSDNPQCPEGITQHGDPLVRVQGIREILSPDSTHSQLVMP